MTEEWQEYQQQSADLFRKLGLSAEIEQKIKGVRGIHKVDVYVEGKYRGIEFKWVVECKAWKSNVSKEKVMALSAIVQDIGADRGFLLSEKGFQSGAIRAATKSNITLTSLNDLSLATEEHLIDFLIGSLHWRMSKVQTRLREIKRGKFDDEYFPPTFEPLGKMMLLDLSFQDAINGKYPIIYYCDSNGNRYEADTFEEFIEAADKLITEAEDWMPPEK